MNLAMVVDCRSRQGTSRVRDRSLNGQFNPQRIPGVLFSRAPIFKIAGRVFNHDRDNLATQVHRALISRLTQAYCLRTAGEGDDEMVWREIKPPYLDVDADTEVDLALKQPFTAMELALRRGHDPRLWERVRNSPFEREYRRRFHPEES